MSVISIVAFWVCGSLAVLFALGVVLSRKPVHSAICLAGLMIALSVLYASLNAPFLFVTQIIVYTGAVMMLFLFVMMILGVDTKDSFVELIKGHRFASVIAVLGLLLLLIFTVGNGIMVTNPDGLELANAKYGSNVEGIAALVFVRYVYIFEATAALLITGAMAAMVFAHGERLRVKPSQRTQLADRMKAYAEHGAPVGPRPGSGVYARGNAIDIPALLPDGTISEDSRSATLVARGAIVDVDELTTPTAQAFGVISAVSKEIEGEENR